MTHRARCFPSLTAISLLSAFLVPSAHGQSSEQRARLTGLRDSLGAVADIAALEQLSDRTRANRKDPTSRLRLGVIRHRLGELTGRRQHLDEAIREFAEVTRSKPDWPDGWYGIALAKLELHDQGFPAKEGPYQRVGSDYLHGAVDAFIKALEADLGFGAAAARLASSVLRETIQPQVKEALGPLRQAARGPGAQDSAIHMAHGLIEREAGHSDAALAAFDRFLQLGGDSAVGLLERARTLSMLGRPGEAEEAYLAAAGLATSFAAVAQLRADLAWIATRNELAQFDSVPSTRRVAWLKAFWQRRDVQDSRAPGERLAEHYRRVFYVMRHFRLVSEKQQRATLSMLRSPQLAGRSPTAEDRLRALVRRLAAALNAALGGSTNTGGNVDEAPTDVLSELHARLNDQTLLRAYRSDQNIVDDRGVIYVRQGEPQKRATYAGGDADPNESWLYLTETGTRIFHFTGLASPTTLVDQLPLNPELLASRGGLDGRYERMADDAGKYRLTPVLREQDRSLGREAIALGTTTDRYPMRFDRDLAPVVQAFGVREGVHGEGQILVVFAARGAYLPLRKADSDSVIVYPLMLRIIASSARTGAVYRIDTTRMFATGRVLRGDELLTGQARLPVPAGRYQLRVVVADERLETGAAVGRDSLTVPDLDAGNLAMSEPVLGRAGSGQRWISPSDTVELNPLNAYPTGSTVEVYYQVGGMKPGHTYETSIEVRRRGKRDRVGAKFSEQGRVPKTSHFRTIVLGKLSAGEYVLTLTIRDANGSASVSRRQSLNVTQG